MVVKNYSVYLRGKGHSYRSTILDRWYRGKNVLDELFFLASSIQGLPLSSLPLPFVFSERLLALPDL